MKYLKLILLSPLVFVLFSSVAFARTRHHHVPPPVPPPVVQPPTSTGLQFGTYNNQKPTVVGTYTEYFTDGAWIGGNNSVVFIEPAMNDQAILAGQFDATLQSFSLAASKYQNVILALGEEMNCVGSNYAWSIGSHGNTLASSLATIEHEAAIARKYDPTIKIAEGLNADNCNGTYPNASYIASGMDAIGLDSFSNGSESWSQLFQPAINNLKGLGKPIDILSEGASSNQSAFVQQTVAGATQNGINLVMWFNLGSYTAPASTLQGL